MHVRSMCLSPVACYSNKVINYMLKMSANFFFKLSYSHHQVENHLIIALGNILPIGMLRNKVVFNAISLCFRTACGVCSRYKMSLFAKPC